MAVKREFLGTFFEHRYFALSQYTSGFQWGTSEIALSVKFRLKIR